MGKVIKEILLSLGCFLLPDDITYIGFSTRENTCHVTCACKNQWANSYLTESKKV